MKNFSKILSGLAGLVLVVPLLAATLPVVPASYNASTPPGPGWNDHLCAEVITYMADRVKPGSAEPIWFSASYGPRCNPDGSAQWGYGDQTLDITSTGGTLATNTVVTNADGWASDVLTGVQPAQKVEVTAELNGGPTAGTGTATGIAPAKPAPTPKVTPTPTPTPPKPKPAPKIAPLAPVPTLKIIAPTRKQVGQPIPAVITILRNGEPDAHALVAVSATTGRLSERSGRTNKNGQIHLTITHAPAGRLAIIATTDRAHGRAVVHVIADPFPWWSLLLLLALVLLGVLAVVASVRQRRRRVRAIGE